MACRQLLPLLQAGPLAPPNRGVAAEAKERFPCDVGNAILRMVQATLPKQGGKVAKPSAAVKLPKPAAVAWATAYP